MAPRKLKILAIDDNQDNLTTLKAVVHDALPEYSLSTCLSGPEGLEAARAKDPDVILLDIVMPRMDGFEVCRCLKADPTLSSIPVVFLTALGTDRESRLKALAVGAEAFLSKPVNEQELVAQVRAMAKLKEAHRLHRMEREQLAALVLERTRELEDELARRRQLEVQLSAKTRTLESVFESAPYLMMLVNQEGRVTDINRMGVRSADKEKAELLGLLGGEVVGCLNSFGSSGCGGEEGCSACPVRSRVMHTWESGEVVYEAEGQLTVQKGETTVCLDLLISTAPVETPAGRLVLVTIADVSERKRAESQLRLQSSALEAAANAIVITDRAGRILWANRAFVTNSGYSLKESVGREPGDLIRSGKHDHEFYRKMWDTILAGGVWRGEVINRRRNGSFYTEEMTITPMKSEAGEITHFIAVKQDITERKGLEEKLFHAQRMEAVGQLAGGVAHDFNNILAATMMHLSFLQRSPGIDARTKTALGEVLLEAKRGATLTRQLLMFSRRNVMQIRPVAINEVVGGMVEMLRRLLGERIVLEFFPDVNPPLIAADVGMLEQVVMNLCVNARDAMEHGGRLTLRTLANHSAPETSEQLIRAGEVCLVVSDTGCGMSESVKKRIFEPFFTTKEVGKGTGLGLATVHGIVGQHEGRIEVESKPNQGTTFRVFLPAAPALGAPRVELGLEDQDLRGNETVLLVEDEKGVRVQTAKYLRACGYEVLEAANGPEAREVWKQHDQTIDLLFSDMIMPEGLSGLDLADEFRKQKPELKVILTSGYSEDLIGDRGRFKDRITFLSKPSEAESISRTIRRCLDGSQQ